METKIMTVEELLKEVEEVVDQFTISHNQEAQCKCIYGARGHLLSRLFKVIKERESRLA